MDLERSLARSFLADHPRDAASVLEMLAPSEAAEVLSDVPLPLAAAALQWMVPSSAATVIEHLPIDRAAEITAELPVARASAMLRRLDTTRRDSLLAAMPAEARSAMGRLLRFPAGTAGALMDPRVTALVADRTAAEAQSYIRRTTDTTLFNLYIVDREQRLVGVLNLDELLSANPKAALGTLMRPAELRISVDASRQQIAAHPGWQHVYSLPVVDAQGVLLGAIRYRTQRQLESELRRSTPAAETSTAQALGDLFATGLGGIVDALAQSVARPQGQRPLQRPLQGD